MARAEIDLVVLDQAGNAVSGASVQPYVRDTLTLATWHTLDVGGTASTAPIVTDTFGRINGWLDQGSYDLTVSGPNITTYTQPWEAVNGSKAPSGESGSVTTAMLSSQSVTFDKIEDSFASILGTNSAISVRRGIYRSGSTTTVGAITLPVGTITVVSTTGFPTSGTLDVAGQPVTYAGKTSTTFTGCAGGAGAIGGGSRVSQVDTVAVNAFTDLGDSVNVVVGSNSLLAVEYRARFFNTVASAGSAAIFVGSNQIQQVTSAAAPAVTATAGSSTPSIWRPLYTSGGLILNESANDFSGSVVTTGVIVANSRPVYIDQLAAGTYSVGVRFLASSGSALVCERVLRVWSVGF